MDDNRSKKSPPFEERSQGARGVLSLTVDVAARFEAGADSFVGGGRAQHPVDRQGSRGQPRIVSLWRHRYADHGLEGLQDKPRPGKQPIYTKTTDKRILKLLDKSPPQGFARWTGPLLAEALGDVDVQYVWRVLRSHKIDLAARKSWCESNDPNFTAKAADVVGLYVAPPAKATVLCVYEKPSIQALERAQGYLKLPNGRALTGQSHDYKRHGTTTLFAALEVATGKIIAAHSKRRRRVEFLDFMNSVTAAFPGRKLHVILDNLNTHKKNEQLAQGPS